MARVVKKEPSKAVANRGLDKKNPAKTARRSNKYDWQAVKDRFFQAEGEISLKDLAEEFAIPYSRIRKVSADERWMYFRAEEQAKEAKKKQASRAKKMFEESEKFDDSTLNTAKLGINLVNARLAEVAKHLADRTRVADEAWERLKNGEDVPKHLLYPGVNHRELDSLARAASVFQDIGRKALGTDVLRTEISGPGGGPIETEHVVNVVNELSTEDPERLAKVFDVLERTGMMQFSEAAYEDNTIEGEFTVSGANKDADDEEEEDDE